MAHKKAPSIYGAFPIQPMWLDKNGRPTFEMPAHVAAVWIEVKKIMAAQQCNKAQAFNIYFNNLEKRR